MTRIRLPSRRTVVTLLAVALVSLVVDALVGVVRIARTDGGAPSGEESLSLPAPRPEEGPTVAGTIASRRSRREYADAPLARDELAQLLWAAQGVTDTADGFRAAPSAGATYPLELYVAVGDPGVEDLDAGVYRYRPAVHDLTRLSDADVQSALRTAAFDQEWIGAGAVDVVVCALDERTTQRYGERGRRRYVPMEAGHAAENVYLQAEALDLATVSVGAFDDDRVRSTVGAPNDRRPLYVMPVGRRP